MHYKTSNSVICLNPKYSTTRLLTVDFANASILSDPRASRTKGGLRTKGYFKESYSEKPLVTVITTVLNAEQYLEDSIKSVVNQSYDNVEYIILDGGSTDATLEIITKYEDKIDLWISEQDKGIYDALNKAVNIANGGWLYVLGADDVLLNVLHRISKILIKENTIYYGDVYLPGRHEIIRGKFTRFRLMYTPMTHQGIFYPKKIFTEYSYDVNYPYAADYELEMRCFNDPRYTFVYMPVLVAIYNDTDGKSANNEDHAFISDRREIIRTYFPKPYYYYYCIRYFLSMILKTLGIKALLKRTIWKG